MWTTGLSAFARPARRSVLRRRRSAAFSSFTPFPRVTPTAWCQCARPSDVSQVSALRLSDRSAQPRVVECHGRGRGRTPAWHGCGGPSRRGGTWGRLRRRYVGGKDERIAFARGEPPVTVGRQARFRVALRIHASHGSPVPTPMPCEARRPARGSISLSPLRIFLTSALGWCRRARQLCWLGNRPTGRRDGDMVRRMVAPLERRRPDRRGSLRRLSLCVDSGTTWPPQSLSSVHTVERLLRNDTRR